MAGATWTKFTIPANFTLGSVDVNITWAISTAGSIWKFAAANDRLV